MTTTTTPRWQMKPGAPLYDDIEAAVIRYAEFETEDCPVGFKRIANGYRRCEEDWYKHPEQFSWAAYEDRIVNMYVLKKKTFKEYCARYCTPITQGTPVCNVA